MAGGPGRRSPEMADEAAGRVWTLCRRSCVSFAASLGRNTCKCVCICTPTYTFTYIYIGMCLYVRMHVGIHNCMPVKPLRKESE